MNEDLIQFAMFLTGHDRETIEQMYKDFSRMSETRLQKLSINFNL